MRWRARACGRAHCTVLCQGLEAVSVQLRRVTLICSAMSSGRALEGLTHGGPASLDKQEDQQGDDDPDGFSQ